MIIDQKSLPQLLLAEELAISDLEAALKAGESIAPEPTEEVERNLCLGGLCLDVALHPATGAEVASEYFEDAQIYWQRVLDYPSVGCETLDARVSAELLINHLPAFQARRNGESVAPAIWDKMDRKTAGVLEGFLRESNASEDKKIVRAAKIGTQLLCGTREIQTYPSTFRESLGGLRNITPEQKSLSHPLYTIRGEGKIPIQIRVENVHLRHGIAPHVLVPFGDLAWSSSMAVAPDLTRSYSHPRYCTMDVVKWLVAVAREENLPSYAEAIIDHMGDRVAEKIDACEKELELANSHSPSVAHVHADSAPNLPGSHSSSV